MDVRYINPFLDGTLEVLKTMAGIEAIPAKPALKVDHSAYGDVSGIIGLTGDAVGSLALSFTEKSICRVVSNMLGEEFKEVGPEIVDAVGELTNMISGAARTKLEKQGLNVYAAIPTVVYGTGHKITHVLRSPSILIPFSTSSGSFFADVCIRALDAEERMEARYGVVNIRTPAGTGSPGTPMQPDTTPANTSEEQPVSPAVGSVTSIGCSVRPDIADAKAKVAGRIEILKARLKERTAKLAEIEGELSKPFLHIDRRRSLKREYQFFAEQIRKIKLDIRGAEMIRELSLDDIENPKIASHYQDRKR